MRIRASDLACVRGAREVFRDVSFTVGSGEALLVTGPNGAGKSSLLRLVAGLLRPAGGRIDIEGGELDLTLGEQALYLGHLDALKPALLVRENLAFWARFLGNGAVEQEPALAAVGLSGLAHVPATYLSAGQRRRLALARLISVKRAIWLLDEPTAARHRSRSHPRADWARKDDGTVLGGKADEQARYGRAILVTALSALMLRDMRLAVRVGGGALIGVLFFLVVVTLVPFAIGPDLALLARIGPAVLWLGALLANLLALDRLIAMDHEDGSLDLMLTARAPLELALGAKALAHWLSTSLPLVVATPLLALLLNLEAKTTGAVALTLIAGTPALTFIGLIGAALTVALRRGGLLLAILILPLTIPVLIFGVAAANAAIAGPMPFGAPLTILCALTLVSIVIGPFAAAAALRHGME